MVWSSGELREGQKEHVGQSKKRHLVELEIAKLALATWNRGSGPRSF